MALNHDRVQSKKYVCRNCTSELKKNNGCKRKKRRAVETFKCICNSENKKCEICKGKGTFSLFVCPQTVLQDYSIQRTFSYFYYWLSSDCRDYPDGLGRYLQPIKMLEAFELLFHLYTEHKNREIELENKESQNGK